MVATRDLWAKHAPSARPRPRPGRPRGGRALSHTARRARARVARDAMRLPLWLVALAALVSVPPSLVLYYRSQQGAARALAALAQQRAETDRLHGEAELLRAEVAQLRVANAAVRQHADAASAAERKDAARMSDQCLVFSRWRGAAVAPNGLPCHAVNTTRPESLFALPNQDGNDNTSASLDFGPLLEVLDRGAHANSAEMLRRLMDTDLYLLG